MHVPVGSRSTSCRQQRRCSPTTCTAYREGIKQNKYVVKGIPTKATPRLAPEKVFERLFEVTTPTARRHYKSFYSSQLGGIVTEPAFMTIHYDDDIVQSAYAVEEVARLMNGYVYNLERVAERLLHSANAAGLECLTSPAALMRIILDTAASSMQMDGYIRIWVTGGRSERGPSLYILVHTLEAEVDRTKGLTAITSRVVPRPVTSVPMTASANDLICSLEARSREADLGVFVDDEGFIIHSPGASVGLITADLELITPPSELYTPAPTMERLMQICPQCDEEAMDVVSAVQRPVHVSEVQNALEVFVTSTMLGVVPVVRWDDQVIGDGTPGINSLAMEGLLTYEYENSGSDLHTEVPYGYLTGMRQQLR